MRYFQQEPCCERETILSLNFALSSNNKNQLRDLCIFLNQEVMTVINTFDGFTLGDNLITNQNLVYVLMPAELLKMTKSIL